MFAYNTNITWMLCFVFLIYLKIYALLPNSTATLRHLFFNYHFSFAIGKYYCLLLRALTILFLLFTLSYSSIFYFLLSPIIAHFG